MLVPEEQGILSASAVYLWQRIKARKIKHFLISPETLPFANLETSILENPFFFFPSAEQISDTTSLSWSPNTSLKDLTKELKWTQKFLSFNYEIAWFTELIRCCSFVGAGAGGGVLKHWKKHTGHHGISHWRWEQSAPALSACWHWPLSHL